MPNLAVALSIEPFYAGYFGWDLIGSHVVEIWSEPCGFRHVLQAREIDLSIFKWHRGINHFNVCSVISLLLHLFGAFWHVLKEH